MSNLNVRLLPETIRSVNTASFDGTTFFPFQIAGVNSPLQFPSRVIVVTNTSGNLVFLSWDGLQNHVAIPAGGCFVFDMQSNSVSDALYNTAAVTQFYARGAVGTDLVYLSSFYAV